MLSAHTHAFGARVGAAEREAAEAAGGQAHRRHDPPADRRPPAIVPKAEDPHSEPPAGVRVVEVWQRELEYMHGPELVRVYEVRPCR